MTRTDIHELITAVERDVAFASLPRDAYLVHAFAHEKGGDPGDVELGYYDPDSKRITSFTSSPVQAKPADEVFTQEERLDALMIDDVAIGLAQARERAGACAKEEFPHSAVVQMVLLLQQADVPVWKVTVIMHTFHMLHVLMDARQGDVRSTEVKHLFDLGTRVPGTGE